MLSPNLPAELTTALAQKAEGLLRAKIAERAAAISRTYRSGGSSILIRTEIDALAYALVRMPATYAAITASLNALCDRRPDFAPRSLLDIGAGPGTAGWAAMQAFDTLSEFHALDANDALRSLALNLCSENPRLSSLRYVSGAAHDAIRDAPVSDLVVASYVINELNAQDRAALADLMWEKTRDVLLVVEPGTPAGYGRILALRDELISRGAHVIAPCPHDHACPLAAPDWCHFSQRLARSRAHKMLKDADAPFEDERLSYVALSRHPRAMSHARVLSQPVITKIAVSVKICTTDGIKTATAARRNKAAYAAAKRWDWGDTVPQSTDAATGINLDEWSSNR